MNVNASTGVRVPVARRHLLMTLVLALSLAACAQTAVLKKPDYQRPPGDIRVLLMPVDIELSTLTAGGVTEPRADWTRASLGFVEQALDQILANRDAEILRYRSPEDADLAHAHGQLIKLHGVIGATLFQYAVLPQSIPPTAQDRFDWHLGHGAVSLGEEHDARYALFVFIRDRYTTGGRKALMFGAALFGVFVPGGSQIGFASLVDLRNGNMVWFNQLTSRQGDLRQPEPATTAVKALLTDFPL